MWTKLALLFVTAASVHVSLSPPQPAAPPKTLAGPRTFFERIVRYITLCTKVSERYRCLKRIDILTAHAEPDLVIRRSRRTRDVRPKHTARSSAADVPTFSGNSDSADICITDVDRRCPECIRRGRIARMVLPDAWTPVHIRNQYHGQALFGHQRAVRLCAPSQASKHRSG